MDFSYKLTDFMNREILSLNLLHDYVEGIQDAIYANIFFILCLIV